MELRLGQILTESGVLTSEQVEMILNRQQSEHKPFGLLCERMFNVPASVIEEAWAKQYAALTRTIDPSNETFDPQVKDLITRRQAWQFRVLPIRFDGEELMLATAPQHLRRALRFCTSTIGVPLYIVVADPLALGEALCRHYPLPGMTPQSVNDNGMDHLFQSPGPQQMSA